jgi:hypothetical protein
VEDLTVVEDFPHHHVEDLPQQEDLTKNEVTTGPYGAFNGERDERCALLGGGDSNHDGW